MKIRICSTRVICLVDNLNHPAMKHFIAFIISFIVVLEYTTCVVGRRIVKRDAESVGTEAATDDVATEADDGGGFPPYNYTGPSDSDDTEHVDFDLDATTTTPGDPSTAAAARGEVDHTPGDGKTRTWRATWTLLGPIAGLTALFFIGVWLGATVI